MRCSLSCGLIAASLTSLLVAPAYALRPNTYVASFGTDSGNCSYGAPCRTFAFALSQVQPGGEVTAIDSAGNAPFTINMAVTIAAPAGVSPSIQTPSGGTAITINASSTDKVVLRGLTLDGVGVGQTGIAFNGGASLTVEDCVVQNMSTFGLSFISTATTGTQTLTVSNSYFSGNDFGVAIEARNQGAIKATIDRTGIYNHLGDGLVAQGTSGTGAITVAVTDSVTASNGFGVAVITTTGHSVTDVSLTRTTISGNGTGVYASATNATVWLAQSTLTGNPVPYNIAIGAIIDTYGDNYIDSSNGAPTGSLTSVGRQ